MRKFLGLASIFGFLAAFIIFALMDRTFQLIFIAIIFVFTLFTVCFYLLTAFEEKKPTRSNYFPSLSIIVPSYNSAKTIKECLQHITSMKYPHKYEIILVDDGSTDDTVKIASEFSVKIMHRKQNKGKAASLNEAIKLATGELIACIDSDTYPPKHLLMESIPHMKGDDIGAMTFFITVHKPKTIWQKMQDMEYLSSFGAFPYLASQFNSILVTPGPLTIFRAEALKKINGFDEKNITEDFEMGLKLHKQRYRIMYLPINVPTEVPGNFSSLMRQRIRWYRGTIYNIFLYKDFMFNRKYADVGTFAFPIIAAYVPITIASFFFVIARAAHFLYEAASGAFYAYQYGLRIPILSSFDIFFVKADMIIFLSFFAFYLLFLMISLSLIGEKITLKRLYGILMVLFIYPFTNSAFYVYSTYKEIAGSDLEW